MSRLCSAVLAASVLVVAELHGLTTRGSTQLAAPTGLTASVSGNTVSLRWAAGAAPVTSAFPNLMVYDTGTSATSLLAVDVPARIYWVRVRGRSGGETSPPSNEVQVAVATGPCVDSVVAVFLAHVGPRLNARPQLEHPELRLSRDGIRCRSRVAARRDEHRAVTNWWPCHYVRSASGNIERADHATIERHDGLSPFDISRAALIPTATCPMLAITG